ncbi:hypothetical protein FE257_011155 [Aspergillus nanangensis]|uniref:Uncharacterized protein n=1 Tax=Aspergillus nanangensis TaxID=2582783 RepID=A0AAD4CIF0_ASPNN|nr:hypothetical protein FE257_011155 [Aspergillus nanangensis]
MSDSVNTQVDIGNLSLTSLGVFSADDVQPIAMIQLQESRRRLSGQRTDPMPWDACQLAESA